MAREDKKKTSSVNLRAIMKVLAVIAIGFALYQYYEQRNRPRYWEAQKEMQTKLSREHHVNALQLNDESEKIVRRAERQRKVTNSNELLAILWPSANRSRDLVRVEKAWDAHAADRDESYLSTEVEADDTDWAYLREIRVPTRIQVFGKVRPKYYPTHESGPDGITWIRNPNARDRTVLMHERGLDNPTPETGKLNQAIGRFCDEDGDSCEAGFPLFSDAVLCVGPKYYEGGHFQGWFNGLVVLDGAEGSGYFIGSGKRKFVITPDNPQLGQTFSTDVCKAHPGELLVKIN
ncbi:MAG: hypothetical protein A3I07_03750 [Candidatus Doudnabacteria bacterium RIFCSPLOWO2_02_FULL_42_9]|uniref:Uncharacterized protein n=1 Tax=Candidatus Doudnabacteria bacterium RIFCSPHIGHO2_01_FULL_41_86 TaxID=1817821 RepID=A0A1F5N8T3_9BACT|nr:MAG: hypothetical protein A2717_00560 [Candidatus Doudnabacteria bacterium RIFCSPHIGHO2_01_FULL_41_86]OGE86434.1 MAG: hypothetical protein A3E28_00435 [Candidatus Doudnabacteria bacterium RIFCSPHIGHO2_12_FULL_42_22]OGE87433.1 MAG: hypothetical protein A3C49_04420 [Candidatus Doudnabacteria bacterium RIFCSPHIGHO2_02_FULL_42_25]OGE92731.1 MAG: hypothetical protein A2895_03915 [Candidatus Doudnabacteria bacterium RIFCSPLOWO2_01_FULL_42_60]OGE94335.1 MAG: hypothetical protein A3K08_02340 [Candid